MRTRTIVLLGAALCLFMVVQVISTPPALADKVDWELDGLNNVKKIDIAASPIKERVAKLRHEGPSGISMVIMSEGGGITLPIAVLPHEDQKFSLKVNTAYTIELTLGDVTKTAKGYLEYEH